MPKEVMQPPPSPTPSVQPLADDDVDHFFSFRDGRSYSRVPTLYPLPSDAEEISRLDNEHEWLKSMRQGKNYTSVVPTALACQSGQQKAILDLGCGTGTWVHEMAEEFPHCSLVGVNLLPIQPRPRLPNYRFEVDDINLGLQHFYNQFDMVHMRFISAGIRDYRALAREVADILKLGGLIHMQEAELVIYDAQRTPIPPYGPRKLWYPQWLHTLATACKRASLNMSVGPLLHDMLKENEGAIWEEIGVEVFWIPVGRWYENPANEHESWINDVGEMLKSDIIASLPAIRPFLVDHSGFDAAYIDSLIDNTTAELTRNEGELKLQMRLHCAWAKKANQPTNS